MQNKMYQYYTELPSWAKGIVVVGGVAVLGYITFKIYRRFFPTDKEKKSRELANTIDNQIKKSEKDGLKQSFTDPNYITFANTLYESMRYAIGDDYGKVVDIMKSMKNNLDVEKLIKAFGFRQNYFIGIDKGEPADLFSWINEELGSEYLGITNYRVTQINNDWAKKGISYKI
jgi:hypothetical protein